MAIPIFSDLVEGIKWLIDFFLNKTPKPVQFLIFLLFITTISLLLSATMHMIGIHCTSQKVPVKTDMLDLFNNARVIFATRDILTETSYELGDLYPNLDFEDVILYAKLNTSLGIYVKCGENDTDCFYYLKHGACYNCTYGDVCISNFAFFCGEYVQICKYDAHAWYGGSLSTEFACTWNLAKIPENFIWNITSGRFECLDVALCGANATYQNNQLDQLLISMDAENLYKDVDKAGIDKMVGVSCINTAPSISFFRIPILDYRIWTLIAVIYALFMLLMHIRS